MYIIVYFVMNLYDHFCSDLFRHNDIERDTWIGYSMFKDSSDVKYMK